MAVAAAVSASPTVAQPRTRPAATTCPAPAPGVLTHTTTPEKSVALTFDDGPGPDTAKILRILAAKGVRATFFNVGQQMQANPQLVRAEAAQGHTLGNHTWDHAHLSQLGMAQQADEMDRQIAEQQRLTGTTPCVFRPPYGEYDTTTLAEAAVRGMSVWNWSCSTQDWMANGALTPRWVERIVARAEAGARGSHTVILMHNAAAPGDPATAVALPRIIDYFRARGFAFVDVLGNHGLAAYAPTGAPGAAATVTTTGLHVFVRAATGAVVERTRRGSGWSRDRMLGGTTSFGPAAAFDGSSAVVALTDRSGHVRVRVVPDHGAPEPWTSIGGAARGRPALAADPLLHRITVAVRTPTGAVAVRDEVRGKWQRWTSLGGRFVTAPSVAATRDGGVSVVAATADGSVLLRHRDFRGWGRWHRVAGGSTADPALGTTTDRRRVTLAVRTATGAVAVLVGRSSGSDWSAPRLVDEVAASGPALTGDGTAVAVVTIDGAGAVVLRRA